MSEVRPLSTTGIGSLPHTSIEEALNLAFRLDIPYVPQLPKKSHKEFMLAHALDGMPGILSDSQGMVTIHMPEWRKGYLRYSERLHLALEEGDASEFLPSENSHCALRPFLAKIEQEQKKRAKVQIAGPMTLQWSLRTTEGKFPPPPVMAQLSRTVLAKSLALCQAIKSSGSQPIIFLDEPGLYAFSAQQPNHLVMMQELKILVLTLQKAGAEVGLHCCSDADWSAVIDLGVDILAIDAHLSLPSLLRSSEALVRYSASGGQLALGVIPTHREGGGTVSEIFGHFEERIQTLEKYFRTRASTFERILSRSLLTPACGMALLSSQRAVRTHAQLSAFQSTYRSFHARRS
ncbi:MAG: hypothetical protein VYC39_06785 [Myxococcota bacterium]|nr:hypothetical protein [Myxococcota bacterium]